VLYQLFERILPDPRFSMAFYIIAVTNWKRIFFLIFVYFSVKLTTPLLSSCLRENFLLLPH